MKDLSFLRPLLELMYTHKFWTVFIAALVASGVTWAADLGEWVPLIVLVGGSLLGGTAVKVQEARAAGK
ncbi:MAG: hypothetical protein AMJ53_02870 [Gammaproteobacteria bacterium SG8_11]|nr:MAG: hypothetical protein AMJ53_02870 [Gammaproteobacteria bacterium SG8_11]